MQACIRKIPSEVFVEIQTDCYTLLGGSSAMKLWPVLTKTQEPPLLQKLITGD